VEPEDGTPRRELREHIDVKMSVLVPLNITKFIHSSQNIYRNHHTKYVTNLTIDNFPNTEIIDQLLALQYLLDFSKTLLQMSQSDEQGRSTR
jgi:hypothetical protein